jgi:beta-lactam-binding protein with PASTA domain
MWLQLKRYRNNTVGGLLFNLALALGILLLIAVIYFYAYLPSSTNHMESITVPNIEGMHVDKLEEFLGKRNLRWEVNDSSYSSEFPALTVLRQYPHAGAKVKENRKIYISINRINPPTVPLPKITEVSLTNADAILKSNDLKRGHIELVAGPWLNYVKEAKLDGKKIEAGTRIPKGTEIDLVVMDGGVARFDAPSIIGYSYEDAKAVLFGSNLSMEPHIIGDTLGQNPVVIKQKPTAGEKVFIGDIVEVWIAKLGTEPPEDEELEDNEE